MLTVYYSFKNLPTNYVSCKQTYNFRCKVIQFSFKLSNLSSFFSPTHPLDLVVTKHSTKMFTQTLQPHFVSFLLFTNFCLSLSLFLSFFLSFFTSLLLLPNQQNMNIFNHKIERITRCQILLLCKNAP